MMHIVMTHLGHHHSCSITVEIQVLMISFFQRTLPLLQDGSQWLEELGPAQSFTEQVFRED